MTRTRRRAGPADAAAIAAIDPTWDTDALAATLGAPSSRAWVVAQDGRVIAHALTSVTGDEAEIVLIAVDPALRRRGIGADLLADVLADWRSSGITAGSLEVRADNTAAIALYVRAGWRASGHRRGYYRDGSDATRMSWSP